MKKLAEIKRLLAINRQKFQVVYGVKRIGIFGSVARNEASELSDIDVLVEFEKPIGLDFVLLGDELEQILGIHVDLVTPNALNPRMFNYIKQDLVYV